MTTHKQKSNTPLKTIEKYFPQNHREVFSPFYRWKTLVKLFAKAWEDCGRTSDSVSFIYLFNHKNSFIF